MSESLRSSRSRRNDRVLEEFGVVKNVKVQGENEALEANRVTEENDAFENDKYKRSEDPRSSTGKGFGGHAGQRDQQSRSQAQEGVPGSSSDMMLHLMAKMMEGMTNLQQQIINKEKEGEPEMVKGQHELPALPEWTNTTGPIDLSDWLVLVEPHDG